MSDFSGTGLFPIYLPTHGIVHTSIRHNVGFFFQGAPSHRPSRPPTIPIPPLGPLDRLLTGLALKLRIRRRLKDLKSAHLFNKILRHNAGRFFRHTIIV